MITISRKCPFSGQVNEMDLPITPWEYEAGFDAWNAGAYIQDVFPTLTDDQREFIKTGITPQKWAELFGEDE